MSFSPLTDAEKREVDEALGMHQSYIKGDKIFTELEYNRDRPSERKPIVRALTIEQMKLVVEIDRIRAKVRAL